MAGRQPLSTNVAVRQAYHNGTYTDEEGKEWRRGMDGWFLEIDEKTTMLVRHDDFVAFIEQEHPE